MSDLFDTKRLADDAAHWDALAERVAQAAVRRSAASEPATGPASLAMWRAGLIAASLLLAASLLYMTTSRRQAIRPVPELGQALAPNDDVGRAIALTAGPPAVGALLLDEQRGDGVVSGAGSP